jgi:PAS domain S-box-containing protein
MTGKSLLRIVLPTLLTVLLFVVAIFLVFIPALERNMMASKREMIRELTIAAWNILANLEQEASNGIMSREQAKQEAIRQIRHLHYGPGMKDYFWINDMTPRMIVHPYRTDLEGKDLSQLRDPDGKPVFMDFVRLVKQSGEGFVEYRWQWQDDPDRVVPKLSYVKGFKPWGWIIGTGIYIDDVRHEIRHLTHHLALVSLAILAGVSVLLLFVVVQGLRTERERAVAVEALRASEERYRSLVESAGESIIMTQGDVGLYANTRALSELGYTAAEMAQLRLEDVLDLTGERGVGMHTGWEQTGELPILRHESAIRRKDGTLVPAVLSMSPVRMGETMALAVVATNVSERRRLDEQRDRDEQTMRRNLDALQRQDEQNRNTIEELRTALMLLEHPIAEHTPARLFQNIREADSPEQVAQLNQQLPALVKVLVENGYKAENINRFITVNTDLLLKAFIDGAIARLGPPPVSFAFLIMGSEGRREQTLCTDQDNAIVYADPSEKEQEHVTSYFLELGSLVCDWLAEAGYSYCKGEMMARNPQWCRPLSAWLGKFRKWVRELEVEDLLMTKIIFDFRWGYGSQGLVDTLRACVQEELRGNSRFFGQLAREILSYAPPVGLFGGLQLTPLEDGRRVFDMKSAMTPIVDFARIYALRHGVQENNTLERLAILRDLQVLPEATAAEVSQAYSALMEMRIEHQTRNAAEDRPPDNLVDPTTLTLIERKVLKEAFAQIKHIQTRLSYDFTGMPGKIS